jgi:hypothetical protein
MFSFDTVFSNWHFMRWLRLAVALFIGIQALQTRDAFAGFVAAFFLFQALTNTGCCTSGSCQTNTKQKKSDTSEEVTFEEIRRDKS